MATIDDDLAKSVTEGFRQAQIDIVNQDLILSGTGDVTVTLADGSKKTGPSWTKLIAAANAAGTSAAAAATSEKNAKTSETNANSSKTAAATSEKNAKTSETNAKTSETNAKTSETNAKTSENNAASSASSAAASLAAAQLLTSVPYEDAPYPDVWAPLNDDLRLLAGFAPYDRLTISGQVLELPTKSLTFSRATTATYIDKSGVLRTAAINEPRFEKEGLLIEGQSTNLLKWSSPTASANEFRFGTGVSVAYLPSGGVEVTKISDSSSWFEQNTGTTDYDPTAPASCSAYLTIPDGATLSLGLMRYNTTDGDKSVLSVPGVNGRNTISIAAVGGSAPQRLAVRLTFPAGFPVGGKVVIDRMQVEPLPFTTSYIPTAGSSVTRAADDCTIQRAGNDNYFGTVTISAEVHCNGQTATDGATASRRSILVVYPSSSEYFIMRIESISASLGKYSFIYGGTSSNYSDKRIDDGQIHTTCSRSNTVQNQSCIDGAQLTSPTNVVRPTPGSVNNSNTLMYIGRSTSMQQMLNGHIRNLRIWHRALTDNQIKGLR